MLKIFSVDDHIVEPADLWTSRVPTRYRDRAPHVLLRDGREYWEYEGRLSMTIGLNAVAGKPREQWSREPARFAEMIPGCYDPKERAKDLLSQGVLASVSFPTLPRFGGLLFVDFEDRELASLCVSAWNDFVLDEWCPAGPPGLFVPMAIVQLWDPPAAAKEIERCVARGARAVTMPENGLPAGLPSYHDAHWDPIWSMCEEAGVPVCMHIGSSGVVPVADPHLDGGIASIVSGSICGMMTMLNFVFCPVPQRHPDIKLVFSEAGIGWIPSLLERADRQFERHYAWGGSELKPSEVFQRNMWACMIEEPIGLGLHEHIGEDKILAETDYPHADTPFPDTQKVYGDLFEGVPQRVVDKITHGNAEALFRWEMADERLASVDTAWSLPTGTGRTGLESAVHGQRRTQGGARCIVLVRRAALLEECGQPLGADGRCREGHRTDDDPNA